MCKSQLFNALQIALITFFFLGIANAQQNEANKKDGIIIGVSYEKLGESKLEYDQSWRNEIIYGNLDFPDVIRFNKGNVFSIKFSGKANSDSSKKKIDDHTIYSGYFNYGKHEFYLKDAPIYKGESKYFDLGFGAYLTALKNDIQFIPNPYFAIQLGWTITNISKIGGGKRTEWGNIHMRLGVGASIQIYNAILSTEYGIAFYTYGNGIKRLFVEDADVLSTMPSYLSFTLSWELSN